MKSNDLPNGRKTAFVWFVLCSVNLGFWIAEIMQGELGFIFASVTAVVVFADTIKRDDDDNGRK